MRFQSSQAQTKSGMEVARGGGKRGMGRCYLINRVQFCKMKRVLVTVCTTMRMYLTQLRCALKNGEDGKLYAMCILPQLKMKQTNQPTFSGFPLPATTIPSIFH